MDIPDELNYIIFFKIPVTITRTINQRLNTLFNDIFISKMHYISTEHKKEYGQNNVVGFCNGHEYYISNRKRNISYYHEIDLMSIYYILSQRNYPNNTYVKNIIKWELLKHKLSLYSEVKTHYMYNFLNINAIMMGIKNINNIKPYNCKKNREFMSMNKLLYKDIEEAINNL